MKDVRTVYSTHTQCILSAFTSIPCFSPFPPDSLLLLLFIKWERAQFHSVQETKAIPFWYIWSFTFYLFIGSIQIVNIQIVNSRVTANLYLGFRQSEKIPSVWKNKINGRRALALTASLCLAKRYKIIREYFVCWCTDLSSKNADLKFKGLERWLSV